MQIQQHTSFQRSRLFAQRQSIFEAKNRLRATPGSRRETTSVSSNSIYTLLISDNSFCKDYIRSVFRWLNQPYQSSVVGFDATNFPNLWMVGLQHSGGAVERICDRP